MSKELIGHVGVDAGLIWIGDPCYIMHKDPGDNYSEVGEDWGDFCSKFYDDDKKGQRLKQFGSIGIACNTRWGDGQFPVYAERADDGSIKSLTIDLDPEDEDEDMDEDE